MWAGWVSSLVLEVNPTKRDLAPGTGKALKNELLKRTSWSALKGKQQDCKGQDLNFLMSCCRVKVAPPEWRLGSL